MELSSENSNAKRKKKENGSKKPKINPATVVSSWILKYGCTYSVFPCIIRSLYQDEDSSKKSVKDHNLCSETSKQGKIDKQKNGIEKNGSANKVSIFMQQDFTFSSIFLLMHRGQLFIFPY